MINIIKALLNKKDEAKTSQFLAVCSACIAVFTVGIHLSWTTPFLKKLMSDEYPFKITEDEASYIVIVAYAGDVIGGISGSIINDMIGRKLTILCMSLFNALSFVAIYLSFYSKALLYLARIAGGISEGAIIAVVPVYIAEIAAPDIRGKLGTFSTLSIGAGSLFINLVGSYVDIQTTSLITLIFPMLLWLIFSSMPESPYYLLMKHRTESAQEALVALRRTNKVEKELEAMMLDVERQMSEKGSFKDLFLSPLNRKVFVILTVTRVVQQFTGCTAFNSYYQILIGMSTDLSPVMGSSLLILTSLVLNFSSGFFVDKFGRKPLLILSTGSVSFVLLVLGTFTYIKSYTSIDVSSLGWFPLFAMVLYVVAFNAGLAVVVNILISEMYSSSIKSKGIALGSILFAGSMMSSTKFYQYTADNIDLCVPFFTFSICSLFGALFFHFFLPETNGKTLEVIQQELRGKKGLK